MRRKGLFFIGIFGLAVSLSVSAQEAPPLRLSLEDCLALAEANNAKLEAGDYAIEGSEWQVNEAKARFKPVLEVTDRMAPVPTDAQNAAESFFRGDITFFNQTKVGVGLPVYAFGKLSTAKNLAAQGVEAAKNQKERAREEIHHDVKRLYFGILFGKEIVDLTDDAIGKIDNQLAKEEEDPEHSPYDIAKLKVFKLELEKRQEEARIKSDLAREALKVQMGLPAEQTVALKEKYLEPVPQKIHGKDFYLGKAETDRAEMELVEIGVAAKALEWQLEKRKLLPNVGLGGFFEIGRTTDTIRNLSVSDDFSNPFNYTRAGVGLEIRGEFDIHRSRAKIKRLQSEHYKALTEAALAKRGMALEIEEAYGEALQGAKNLDRAEERKKLARQMLFLSKSNIEVGVGDEEEYTDALQLVLLTKSEYFKAVFDYNVALAKLEWKAGGR
ncbi:MAG: TolC family protein [Deltaproteobacteria bacterium]|nr:TolC family protein [Deltaproteobacteria bacterium]MBI4223856.1 TolC family protein [Deltaproteobacteria bacterium]